MSCEFGWIPYHLVAAVMLTLVIALPFVSGEAGEFRMKLHCARNYATLIAICWLIGLAIGKVVVSCR